MANEKLKAEKAKIAADVDDFFAKRKEKEDNYVPKQLAYRQLPVGLYEIFFPDGGEVCAEAKGLFTTLSHVQRVIDNYNIRCPAKQV